MTSYSERKNTLSRHDLAGLNSKWANRPAGPSTRGLSEERRRLWTALNQAISERGGKVTSVPFTSPMRVEVDTHSTLPEQLARSGFQVVFICQEMRVTGATSMNAKAERLTRTAPSAFMECAVYEIRLGGR
jgi:hypothetical protein